MWSHFQVTVPMSTYLVAYSINDFEYKESVVKMTDDVIFRIWARRDALDQVRMLISFPFYFTCYSGERRSIDKKCCSIIVCIRRWNMLNTLDPKCLSSTKITLT